MTVVALHDDLVRSVREAVERLDPHDLSRAFVGALRSRRFEHWSSLASFALANTLPVHEFSPIPGRPHCRMCGASARLEAFRSDAFRNARTSGVVRLDSLRFTRYDLAQFADEDRTEPDALDRACFDTAISRIAGVSRAANVSAAERSLGIVFPSRIDRKLFLGVLGACGILASPTRPGFWPEFVPFEERARLDPSPYTYPVAWWRGDVGVKRDAIEAIGLERFLSSNTLALLDPGGSRNGSDLL